jgi:hypothetical protein
MRADAAKALVDVGVQGSGVHANANGHAAVLRFTRHQFDLFGLTQVAGVKAQSIHARLESGQRHFDVKVNVRDDRHRRTRHDLGQPFGGGAVVARAAHDVGTVGRQRVDLLQRALNVGRLGRGHGLHGDGIVTPDLHGSNADLTSLTTRG